MASTSSSIRHTRVWRLAAVALSPVVPRKHSWPGGAWQSPSHRSPSGGPWCQLHCITYRAYFLATYGRLSHGKGVPTERLVRVVAALAEGWGVGVVARVFEVDPNG